MTFFNFTKARRLVAVSIASAALLLGSCAQTEMVSHIVKQVPAAQNSKTQGYFKVGSPYKIKGRRYKPREMYKYKEKGTASWYGPGFHGKLTANGEVFDENAMTAAHRTLQMPAIIKVTNLDNGRAAIMRVNDRGPFAHNRILDVSKRGAEVLGFKNAGVARIKIELMPKESRIVAEAAKAGRNTRGIEVAMAKKNFNAQHASPTIVPPKPILRSTARPVTKTKVKGSTYFVQAGAFSSQDNAVKLAQTLNDLGDVTVQKVSSLGRDVYKVRIGPIPDASAAQNILPQVQNRGLTDAMVLTGK